MDASNVSLDFSGGREILSTCVICEPFPVNLKTQPGGQMSHPTERNMGIKRNIKLKIGAYQLTWILNLPSFDELGLRWN